MGDLAMFKTAIVIAAALLLSTASASAVDRAVVTEALKQACVADTEQFCGDVKKGGGRIAACMDKHAAELSDPCKDALAQVVAGKI
jgi:hypothetical protein